jgi:hypothetical protein
MLSAFDAWALPKCPDDPNAFWTNCIGTYTTSDGGKFVGEFKDDKYNGQGTYTWPDGRKYVGEWKDDLANGQGTYTLPNGEKYVGENKDGLANGQGTYTFANGDKYVGAYKDDFYNGQGTLFYANGNVAEGIWENGEFKYAKKADPTVVAETAADQTMPKCPDDTSLVWSNCFGTFEEDGSKYVGEWINNERSGQGTHTQDGAKYVGEFRYNKYNGQGTFTFSSGEKYVGEFKDDLFNGQGALNYSDGAKYVGDFKDDKANGYGTWTFANGDRYLGEFKDFKFNGYGTLTYADGDKYVGEFDFDRFNGQGTYFYADGTSEEGIWENGELKHANQVVPPLLTDAVPLETEVLEASSGSGFAVSSDGYVVTNNHVIEGCQEVFVHDNGKVIPVIVVTYDLQNDLALLKGDFQPKAVLPLSDYQPQLLQDIYVAGYPFGNEISSSIKVTKGIISSLTGIGNNFSNIQIDAALQSGNSGGPIIDDMGNVVGVAVSKLDAEYMFENYGDIPENTNFGIKSSVVRSVLDSNGVSTPAVSTSTMSKVELGQEIKGATYYISCWMTMAQIEQLRTTKVLFDNLK